jgi:predicted transcriptional regulator
MAKSEKQTLGKMTAVRFDADVLERLAQIGESEDRSVSWLIRKAVSDFVADWKPAKK